MAISQADFSDFDEYQLLSPLASKDKYHVCHCQGNCFHLSCLQAYCARLSKYKWNLGKTTKKFKDRLAEHQDYTKQNLLQLQVISSV